MDCAMGCMAWMHAGATIVGLMTVAILGLGIAALIKYLRSHA